MTKKNKNMISPDYAYAVAAIPNKINNFLLDKSEADYSLIDNILTALAEEKKSSMKLLTELANFYQVEVIADFKENLRELKKSLKTPESQASLKTLKADIKNLEKIIDYYEHCILPVLKALVQTVKKDEKVDNNKARSLVRKLHAGSNFMKDPDEQLINMLRAYIDRIDDGNKHQPENKKFTSGFVFFKERRAANRKMNYLMAKAMLQDLENTNKPINEIFSDLSAIRRSIEPGALTKREKSFVHNKINSDELNKVIKTARKFK